MFLADLGLVKLIPEQDKCTLAPTYQCLIGAVHLKALTLASPLQGGGVGWGRRKQQQKLNQSHVCTGWVVKSVRAPVQQVIAGLRRPVL